MIRGLEIRSFKAFSEGPSAEGAPAEAASGIPLQPFNLIVGPNGSGKSTILQAIEMLGLLVRGTLGQMLETHGWEYADLPHLRALSRAPSVRARLDLAGVNVVWTIGLGLRHRQEIATERISVVDPVSARRIVVRVGRKLIRTPEAGGGGNETTEMSLPSSWLATVDPKEDRRRYPTLVALADWARHIRAYYFLDPVVLRAPSRAKTDNLGPHGENLAAFLARLKKSRPKDFARLIARVRAHYPRLVDLHIRRTNYGWTHVEVTEKWNGEQAKFNARQVSDGLLRLVAVAAMHELREPPSVLLIDEIENGLHPRLLGGLVAMLEELAATGRTQVIATTHSPIALNYVASPESVLLVTRGKGGGVKVTPMPETKDFESLREHFELGELWFNVGEERLVPRGKK